MPSLVKNHIMQITKIILQNHEQNYRFAQNKGNYSFKYISFNYHYVEVFVPISTLENREN